MPKRIPDSDVIEIRRMYDEHVAQRTAGERPKWAIVDIAKLFNTSPKWVTLIGQRLARDSVPDTIEPQRAPAQPIPNTVQQQRRRAAQPRTSKRYPAKRRSNGTFEGN